MMKREVEKMKREKWKTMKANKLRNDGLKGVRVKRERNRVLERKKTAVD